jgi:rubrerythrin
LQQLTDETQEAAETQRQLGMDLKKAMAPVKAKERDINLIKREQNAALRNLQNARKALQDERDAILAAAGHSDEAKRAATLKEAEAEHDQLVDNINHLPQTSHDHEFSQV